MKNISLVLNIVLLLAVGVLYYFHFSGGKKGISSSVDHEAVDSIARNLTIAYINYDSLLAKYDWVQVLNDELVDKKAELDASYESAARQEERALRTRAEKFQLKVREFENKSGEMPEFQTKQTMMNLQNEETEIRQAQYDAQVKLDELQEKFGEEIVTLQLKNSEALQNAIHDYLDRYNAEHNFSLIFAMAQNSNLWHAHNSLNITDDIVNGLNAEYAEKAKAEGKKEEKK